MAEVGVVELGLGIITVFVGYLILQWWQASKSAASGQHSLAAVTNKGGKVSADSSSGKKLPMTIFFGSQSGTAETFAHELCEEAKMRGFKAVVQDLEDYPLDDLASEKFCVFLMATFGEGDPTDNAVDFYEWINSGDREEGLLADVNYAVFALGNRQYEQFCAVGIQVDKRMNELGARRVIEHGEGDDDGSLEDDYSTWKTAFWAATAKKFGLSASDEASQVQAFKPSFAIEFKPSGTKYTGGLTPAICDPKHKPILATCLVNRELRQEHTGSLSTRHLELDVSSLRLSYVTADNLGVCPRNDYKLAAKMAQRLKVDSNQLFVLKPLGKKKSPITQLCSVQDALLWYLDFQSVPRAALLTTLAQYTNDAEEKQKLHHWTHEGKDEYHQDQKSLLEVLEHLPGVQPPFLDFLEWCPKLQPRFYTISSSSLVQPKQISITVALSTQELPRNRVYNGIASTYLCGLKPSTGDSEGDKVCVFLRTSTFRLPKPKRLANAESAPTLPPVIMVGPGTGVAPFRAFLQEFTYLKEKNLTAFPHTELFFGCRRRNEDFIYSDEFEAAQKKEALTVLHTAFSREQASKDYVQSHIKREAARLWTLLFEQKAYFYVCGGTVMGRQVKDCVLHMAQEHGKMSPEVASEWLKKLTLDGRYVQELWS